MAMSDTEILTEPVAEMTCTACGHPLDVTGLTPFIAIACPECHSPQTVPAKLGGFLLVEMLGKGGMGAVYRGRDTSLDRWVAVKVMLTTLGSNREFVETFRREAQAAAALNHPNVVQIYSFGVEHSQPYMVMELLEGGRMDQMIAKGEPLNEALVFKMATDVAEGLNAAANIGLIHGDVKPENILIDSNGTAKIVDFGLARFKQSAEPGVKGVWGTPYYIAPEKIRGHPGDARSDIYSLGATIFHALTLKPPFDGQTPIDVVKARLKAPAPALKTLRADVDDEVAMIVARMLEAEPIKRYPTYLSLLADMRKTAARLKPAAEATLPSLTKRGGRIVVTKRRPSAGIMVAASTGPITVPAKIGSMAGGSPVAALPEENRPLSRRAKMAWMIASGIAGLLVIAGIVTGLVIRHNRVKAREAAVAADQVRLTDLRTLSEKLLSDVNEQLAPVLKSVEAAKGWKDEADMAMVSLKAATARISDTALVEEANKNGTALAKDITAVMRKIPAALAEFATCTNALVAARSAALAATNAAPAEAAVEPLVQYPVMMKQKASELAGDITKAQDALRSLLELKKKVSAVAAVQAEEQDRLEKDRAERERLEREAEEKRRLAEEQEQLSGVEVNLVDDTRKANATMIQQNQVQLAADAMAAVGAGLKTDGGKGAHKAAMERYRLIGELKGMIIRGIARDRKEHPETGFKFGWLVNGVPTRDVLAADEEKVTFRGGTATWAEVSPAQMLKFIRRYAAGNDLSRREAGGYLLGAACYVVEAGAGSDNAKKLAADLVREASSADPKAGEKARTLLPELEGL